MTNILWDFGDRLWSDDGRIMNLDNLAFRLVRVRETCQNENEILMVLWAAGAWTYLSAAAVSVVSLDSVEFRLAWYAADIIGPFIKTHTSAVGFIFPSDDIDIKSLDILLQQFFLLKSVQTLALPQRM